MKRTAEVTGVQDVLKKLKILPDKLQRKVIRKSVSKSATLLARDVRKRIPKGRGLKPTGQQRKPLKSSIKTKTKTYKNTGVIAGVVGADKNAFHAHLVHDGTTAHEIPLSKPLVLGSTVLPAGFVIQHPGAKSNPYVEDAANAMRGNLQNKMRTEMLAGLEVEVKKLAKSVG